MKFKKGDILIDKIDGEIVKLLEDSICEYKYEQAKSLVLKAGKFREVTEGDIIDELNLTTSEKLTPLAAALYGIDYGKINNSQP